ncbi:tetratricopeptide repeat protein [Streptomyces sp. NBC_01803]|nr:tetratricopeptide repeat protein [Streptomyces sp. NBC_01803]WSA45426.1 tetratricopeptide repeat protein [Streptomyces sp. NBC_01803]
MHPHASTIGGSARIHGPSIQAGQIQGGIHVHAAGQETPPVPRQLLRVSTHFTGREQELAALSESRAHSPDGFSPLIVVTGPAGIGKTALVSRWLRGTTDDFPDGHLYADLRAHAPGGPALPGEILGQFLRALGAAAIPADPQERMALWRSVTERRAIAIMLDNVFTAAQARPLLPGGERGLVVATSRYRLTGLSTEGAVLHQLGPLEPEVAVQLLSRGVGRERMRDEAAAARRIVALCAGMPLAVCLASARLASRPRQPVRALADALAQEQRRLTELAVEGETVVRSALDESYAALPPDVARLYRRLGPLPVRTFEARLVAAACAVPVQEAERLLDALIEANLIEDIGPDSHRFHDLVRIHAAERAAEEDSGASRTETLRRTADWCLATTSAAQRMLTPAQATMPRAYAHPPAEPRSFADETDALAWMESRRSDLLAVARAASAEGWHDTVWQQVDALWPLFLRLRHYDLWIEAHGLGLAAAREAGNGPAERRMLNSGAIGLSGARRLDDAIDWYTASLRAAREAGDARDEGQALLGLGACHRDAGRLTAAAPHLTRAITVWKDVGYLRGAALARIVLGEIAAATGDLPHALDCFTEAREELTALTEPYEAARASAFLGHTRAVAGDFDGARAELGAALAVFEAAGASHWQARTLEMLGDSALRQRDAVAARGYLGRSLALFTSYSPADASRVRGLLDRTTAG